LGRPSDLSNKAGDRALFRSCICHEYSSRIELPHSLLRTPGRADETAALAGPPIYLGMANWGRAIEF
jgi:hypothetical protein